MQRVVYPNLFQEMVNRNISFSKMATAIGLSKSSFYRRMIGEVDWKLHEVLTICEFLGYENPIQLFLRFHTKT